MPKLVKMPARIVGDLKGEELTNAVKELRELADRAEKGELDAVVFVAVASGDIHQGAYGAGNDFYRLAGAMQALHQYLMWLYHVGHLVEE